MGKRDFSEDSFNIKYDKYSPLIFRIAYQYTLSRDFAEDIMQEVFIKLLTYKKPFKDGEHEKAWLIRVTVNCCKNLVKSKAWSNTELTESLEAKSSFEESSNAHIDIESELKKLSSDERTVIYLFYFEQYTSKEISKMLNMNENTVKSHLRRAKSKMKNNLERQN